MNTSNIAGGSALVEACGVHNIEGVDHLAVLWTIIALLVVTFGTLLGAYVSTFVVLGTIALMCMQVEGFLNNA